MSTTAYENTQSSRLIRRRNSQTSSIKAMTNDRSQYPLRTNHFLAPIPPIRESISSSIKRSLSSSTRNRLNSNENKIYTFSNPPCELQRKRPSSASQRVSSAPDECSPRSRLNQPKSSSASGSIRSRLTDEHPSHSIQSKDHLIKQNEQEKDSLNALLKQQEKSTVPKSVQKRRIVLLFHRTSPRQDDKSSSAPTEQKQLIIEEKSSPTKSSPAQSTDLSESFEAEMADSMQLAAILAQIQLGDESNSNGILSQPNQAVLDPSKYEYIVANPLDTATYRLSPRTLKPNEESAARSRFSQYYGFEMKSSANAQIPPLIASIVAENTLSFGTNTDAEQIITFKLNSADIAKQQTTTTTTADNELVQLCYDATLKRFYDPNTGKYYELTSE